MESGFELINLAATVADPPAVPESSDDGLDPTDFLSQSHDFANVAPASRPHTISPHLPESLDLTPTLLVNDVLGNTTRLSDSGFLNNSLVADSFHFVSADSIYRTTHGTIGNSGESPLEYLQKRNESLGASMKKAIRQLNVTLQNGDDCANLRLALVSKLALLSENCYLLHEIYTREQTFVNSLLLQFESWDRRRSKVLRKVQSIKSQENKHGTKLADLLDKRAAIDVEIDLLERCIAILKENRGVVGREIDETSSILESKSAKYVNHFRELERQGREAISEYLYLSGLPEKHLEVLLKSEPVNAAFSYTSLETSLPRRVPSRKEIETTTDDRTREPPVKLTPSSMGVQPLEVPQDFAVAQPEEESPYAKGFAKGTEQLEKLRKTLNEVVTQVFPPAKTGPRRVATKVDDEHNTITQKIDLVPITELLTHKLEAISKLIFVTSKLSAEYHDQSVTLKDMYMDLDSNERALVTLLSEMPPSTDGMLKVLERSFSELSTMLQNQTDQLATKPPDVKVTYLAVVLHYELKAVARAISDLTHDPKIELEVPELESSILKGSVLRSEPDPRTSFKITSAGFRPTPTSTVSSQFSSAQRAGRVSPYALSSKGMKNE